MHSLALGAVLRPGELRREGSLGGFHELGEGRLLVQREIGEHLTVDFHVGLMQAIHEPAIGHAMIPCPSVNTLDPERPEMALLLATVPVGVLPGLGDRLHGGADVAAPGTVVALCSLQNLVAPCPRDDAALYACHGLVSLATVLGQHALNQLHVGLVNGLHTPQMTLTLSAFLREDVVTVGGPALKAVAPLLKALECALVGLNFRHVVLRIFCLGAERQMPYRAVIWGCPEAVTRSNTRRRRSALSPGGLNSFCETGAQ